jgi:hypothetical protein
VQALDGLVDGAGALMGVELHHLGALALA